MLSDVDYRLLLRSSCLYFSSTLQPIESFLKIICLSSFNYVFSNETLSLWNMRRCELHWKRSTHLLIRPGSFILLFTLRTSVLFVLITKTTIHIIVNTDCLNKIQITSTGSDNESYKTTTVKSDLRTHHLSAVLSLLMPWKEFLFKDPVPCSSHIIVSGNTIHKN